MLQVNETPDGQWQRVIVYVPELETLDLPRRKAIELADERDYEAAEMMALEAEEKYCINSL
jgi:hypothetical protein